MKTVFFVGLMIVGAVFCDSKSSQSVSSSEELSDDLVASFRDAVKEKCQETGNKYSEEKLTKAIKNTYKCLGEHLPNSKSELQKLRDDSDSAENICSEKRHDIKKCIDKAIPVIEDCCGPEEKYFPNFILSAFDGLWDFACANEAEAFKKINNATVDCLVSIAFHEGAQKACGDNYRVFRKELPANHIAKKEDLCHDLDEAKSCWSKFVSTVCPDEKHLQFIISGIHKAVTGPCHENPANPLNLNLPHRR